MPLSESASVSLVITTYNHARYLGEAIESGLNQTIPALEIIVVDDGSTDHPEAVTSKYPEVRLIRQMNQGLACARNTGTAAVRGEFLVFLDADDRLLPQAFEINLDQFAAHPECGFVYGAHDKVDAEGRRRWAIPLKPIGEDPYETTLRGNPVGMHATVMYRRDRLNEIGGFNTRFRACEDYDVYLRMAQRFPIACLDDCLASYRQHDSNMSKSSTMMLNAALTVLKQHRINARSRRRWWAAYRAGIQGWKDFYTGEHMRIIANSGVRSGLMRQTAGMFWLAPLTAWHAALEARRDIRRNS